MLKAEISCWRQTKLNKFSGKRQWTNYVASVRKLLGKIASGI